MILATAGYLPPVAGAVAQELIDVVAVLNAICVALPFTDMTDFERLHDDYNGVSTVAFLSSLPQPTSAPRMAAFTDFSITAYMTCL